MFDQHHSTTGRAAKFDDPSNFVGATSPMSYKLAMSNFEELHHLQNELQILGGVKF